MELPWYFFTFFTTIFVLIVVAGLQYIKRKRIILPSLFYMRKDYLHKVIPALQKMIKFPSNELYIDFSQVEGITKGSYMVLLAQAEKAIKIGKIIYVFKKLPKSQEVLKILGYKGKIFHKDIDLTKGDAFTNNTVDTQMVDELVSDLKRIGINEYYQIFYDFLVELIGNATEHGIQHNKISWWLLKYRVPEQKAFKYVFVDMGVGIIRSYKESKSLGINRFRSSKWIVNNAFDGKLGSSTGQGNRGRGLPFIRSCVEKGFISDFILITNNVSLQCLDGKIVENSNPDFVGTYLSWTINKENFIRWKNSK